MGKLRWQAPVSPPQNNSQVTLATEQPPECPQTGAFGVPEVYGFNSGPGDEDCLFLNVYAAPNASNLPVLLWIRKCSVGSVLLLPLADPQPAFVDGGGYSDFGAIYDPSVWMNTNFNGFVTVEIQYRLGAFGFLASSEIKANGKLNVGLLDQRFALEWVQKYIAKFGGNPSRVTVGGESSGAGSVMYQSMAYGGQDSNLFNNVCTPNYFSKGSHH